MKGPMFRRTLALTLTLALGSSLVACGGGGDAADNPFTAGAGADIDSADIGAVDDLYESPDPIDGADTSGGSTLEGSIEFALPPEADVPSGFMMIGDNCAGDDRGAGVRFVYPEDWNLTGYSRGGSGAHIDGSVGHTFSTAEGRVYIEAQTNTIATGMGQDEEAESFDYDYTFGDRAGTVTYDQTMTTTVSDQEVSVWEVDETRYPDMVDGRQLKFTVKIYELTTTSGMNSMVMSVTVRIDLPIDSTTGDDVIRTIIGSLNVSDCTRDNTTAMHEAITNIDLDGDGEITKPEDLLAGCD